MTAPATKSKPKAGTLPKGTFDAQIRDVATVRRKEDRSWVLRILVRTTRLERDAVVWQGLAADGEDPFALDDRQLASLRRFAEKLGIRSAQTAEEIVEDLAEIASSGEVVQCKVSHGPVGQQASIFKETVVLPAVREPSEEDAEAAQGAHEKFLAGLAEARAGLAYAAEGAYLLKSTEGWKALGYENVSEYLAAPEITMSRSEFYRLAEIWERYVLNGGVPVEGLQGVGPTKLEVPLPALEAGVVSAVQALADATSMPRSDLREHYQGLLGNDDEDNGDGEGAGSDESSPAGGTVDDPVLRDVTEAIAEAIGHVGGATAEELARLALSAVNGSSPNPPRIVVPEAAHTVTRTLRRVLVEVGRPEQKRMSKELRQAVQDALTEAEEHGLGDGL